MSIKRTIALYPFEKPRHSLHKSIIEFLKIKYNIIYNPDLKRREINYKFNLLKFYPLRKFYHNYLRNFITLNDLRFAFKKEYQKKLPYDLLYSVAKIPPYENNYIIDFEKVVSFTDHSYERINKKYLEKKFSEPNCKKVIPWYDIAERSLIETLDCSQFKDKIQVVPFAIKSDKIKKNYNKGTIDFLFVSSINNPYDFEFKGGILALEVYSRLIKKYPNLTFTIESPVSKWIEEKYKDLKGLKFIKEFVSKEEFNKILLDADILLEPGAGTNLMLDCMNYAIPGIAFDRWEIPEMIIEWKNGFNVDSSLIYGKKETKEEFQHYLKKFHLNHLTMYRKKWPDNLINDFAEKAFILIEDNNLRKKMSKNAKSLVEKGGRYNLEKRNKTIIKIFEEALG